MTGRTDKFNIVHSDGCTARSVVVRHELTRHGDKVTFCTGCMRDGLIPTDTPEPTRTPRRLPRRTTTTEETR